jgi:hypothetical protein
MRSLVMCALRRNEPASFLIPSPGRRWLFRFFFGQQHRDLYAGCLVFGFCELFSIVLEILAVNERLHCTTVGT